MPAGCNRPHLSSEGLSLSGDCCKAVADTWGRGDSWADSQTDTPNRSEAIRRLVELGLKAKK